MKSLLEWHTSTLNQPLLNSVDNTKGTIAYAAGRLLDSFPGDTFTLATIRLKALKSTSETQLTFISNYEEGRVTKVTWECEDLTVEPIANGKVAIVKADFTAQPDKGAALLKVRFTDKSEPSSAISWA